MRNQKGGGQGPPARKMPVLTRRIKKLEGDEGVGSLEDMEGGGRVSF